LSDILLPDGRRTRPAARRLTADKARKKFLFLLMGAGKNSFSPPSLLFAHLLLGFAKIFSEADGLSLFIVALAPPFLCAGNKKELPDFV